MNINKRTLWCGFLTTPTEIELQEVANTIKGGKGYLFIDEDGMYHMCHRRRLGDYEWKDKKFIKRILSNN